MTQGDPQSLLGIQSCKNLCYKVQQFCTTVQRCSTITTKHRQLKPKTHLPHYLDNYHNYQLVERFICLFTQNVEMTKHVTDSIC